MKTNLILALLLLLGTASHAQNTKKFTYKLTKSGRNYVVEPNFEEPGIPKGLKGSMALNRDGYPLLDETEALLRLSIPKEKWNKLVSVGGRILISASFSGEGKFYRLYIIADKKHLEILSDDDFYAIYQAFENYKTDMTRIRLITDSETGYTIRVEPQNYDQYYWTMGGSMVFRK